MSRKYKKSDYEWIIASLSAAKSAIILGYYDGHAHVNEQLKSIFQQTMNDAQVFVVDDHSTRPFSSELLDSSKANSYNITVNRRTNNVGFCRNFLCGLAEAGDEFEFYAFSDQDDIWYEDKLERAIEHLSAANTAEPALYCAATEYVDENNSKTLGYSPVFTKPPSFQNALTQNIGGGNTMVMNKAARELIVSASQDIDVVSHDWWCYQLITAAGGKVIYDPKPCLRYRQHPFNIVGANRSPIARFKRIKMLLLGGFREWNNRNLNSLAKNRHTMTATNQQIFEDFVKARQSSLIKRLFLVKRSGIHRQTLMGNLGLLFGLAINRL
jgi:glycosyltransferase involved in cell wall biosynthesis